MSLVDFFFGYREAPEPVPAIEAPKDAFSVAPEPSIIEREQMEIDAKRVQLRDNADCYDAAVYYHEKQASIFRARKADTLRILDGLDKHEAVINAKLPEALEAVGAEIDAAIEEIRLHDQVADEIEQNLEDRDAEYDAADDGRKSYDAAVAAKRKRGDKHWPKRASELAAAE